MLNYVSKTHKILETSIFGIQIFSGFVPNNFVPKKYLANYTGIKGYVWKSI